MCRERNTEFGMSYGYVRTAVDSFASTGRQVPAATECGATAYARIVEHATGAGKDRPGLRHLLHLAERGMVKQIVVRDRSRLARSHAELACLLDRLDWLGVRVTVASAMAG